MVDDDRTILRIVGGDLTPNGYRVRRASNGIEALDLRLVAEEVVATCGRWVAIP